MFRESHFDTWHDFIGSENTQSLSRVYQGTTWGFSH